MSRTSREQQEREEAEDTAFNNSCRDVDYPSSRDRSLWCAVLHEAVLDKDHDWFRNDIDFSVVCDMADVDADAVRERVLVDDS